MRAVPIVLLLTLSVGCSSHRPQTASSPQPTLQSRVRVHSDCEHPAVRPKEILVACGDGSYILTKVTYTDWGELSAHGKATAIANDFTPNRAMGKDHSYAVTFSLDRPLGTAAGLLFSRLTVRYQGAAPYGKRTESFPLAP